MKFCKDCKYYVPDIMGMRAFAKCKHPQVAKRSPVDGIPMPVSISLVRSNAFDGACREEGILFVAAEEVKEEVKQPWYKRWLKFIY